MKKNKFNNQLGIFGIGLLLLMGCENGEVSTEPASQTPPPVSQTESEGTNETDPDSKQDDDQTDEVTPVQLIETFGIVMEIIENGVKLNEGQIFAMDDEESGEAAASIDLNNEDWITVLFHENTVFLTTKGQGESYQITPATISDLYLDDSIEIVGRQTDAGILADEVSISLN